MFGNYNYYEPDDWFESEYDYECDGELEIEVDTEEKWEIVDCDFSGEVILGSTNPRRGIWLGECPKCSKAIELEV